MDQDLSVFLKEKYRPKKIAVCTAWGSPFSWTHGVYNMANLIRPDGVEVKYIPGFGRDPGRRHMWGVEQAFNWGASHICFLGTDQLHDLDILVKFCKHIVDGWPMVTALVPARSMVDVNGVKKPFQKLAWKWKPGVADNGNIRDLKFSAENLEVLNWKDANYQECVVVGSGALMFDIGLLEMLERPWFREADADENGWKPATMDTTFCWRLVTEAGGRLLADCTIDVVHLDIFPIDESYADRFSDWAKKSVPTEVLVGQIKQ